MKDLKENRDRRERVGDRVTIYPRGKRGIFIADFWDDGEHCRKSLNTTNRRIARQRAVEIDHQLATGGFKKPKPAPKTLVADAVDSFIEFKESEGLRPKSITRYRGELQSFATILQTIGVMHLSEVTIRNFDHFRSERAKARQPKTIYHESLVTKQFMTWCESRELVLANPLSNYKVKKPPHKQMPVPTLGEIEAILRRCSQRNRDLITMLCMTGMRIGELQGLLKRNVDLGRGMIIVERQVDGPTKTKDARKIPIHPRLKPILTRLMCANDHELLVTAKASQKYPDGSHHICDKRLNLALKAAAATVTDAHYTLHSCRRFFNTFTINQGVPERVVRIWMGHRDRSMTGVYYELRNEESCAFMQQVNFGELGTN